ncbi:ABC transporter ATP-binding protein [Asticcacaulis sp. BYS171W]|uniref:ABC transporter ATP-binding protein n=1 Tax=Asticcacaulis aquaticus TaxID=2984212 RepID=A0ABT5HYT4_9CAUL|nr:ABC transporter ATP-binding protein [Asticcacaulis aquaticus]MDC7685188.1 ABC transporter ATP-binding protein [Asticcacaulis aquaticus]
MTNIWKIIQLIPEYRGRIIGLILSSAVLGLGATATPYVFRSIVNTITDLFGQRVDYAAALIAVGWAVGAFAVIRLFTTLFGYWQDHQSDQLWLHSISTLRRRVFETMTGLSLDYYERNRVGDITDRFGNCITVTQWLFQLSEGTLASILQLVFGIIVLLIKAPAVGLVMLLLVPYNLISSYLAVKKTKPLRRRWNGLVGKMSGLLSEMVSQIATVRSFAGERIVQRRYDAVQDEWWDVRRTETGIEQRSAVVVNLINSLAVIGSIGWVAWGALHQSYTVGDILLVFALTQAVITTIVPITRLVNTAGDVDSASERLVELIEVPTTVTDRADATEVEPIRRIEFRNVGFTYPGQTRPALRNLSFTAGEGQTVALVGPSGSGKSTIIKLAMRFYDVSEGEILINGRDIRSYTQNSLRTRIGAVLQDIALFNDSIGDNISFARVGAQRDDVIAASKAAHADNFISRLPEGYDTMVGERGVRLSGGEKQRIAIARAILRDPSLIILDEATSALDTESEKLVQDGLKTLLRGRTALVIAHRLSTIASADKIIVMKDGQIAEEGDHASLLDQQHGLYSRLHGLQTA